MKINAGAPDAVQVLGYPIDQIVKVNQFRESLHRQWEVPTSQGKPPPEPSFALVPDINYEEEAPSRAKNVRSWPGMIVGAGTVGIRKEKDGTVRRSSRLLKAFVRLEVLGLDDETVTLESAKPTPRYYWIVDDSRTQIWQVDAKNVYVPFDVLQKDLGMNERTIRDPDTKESTTRPARTTEVHVKAKPGVDLIVLRDKVKEIVAGYYPYVTLEDSPIAVETWEETNATWIGAVEKEKGLVTFLFGMISIVAIFLIFCIFYMIVVEKTRDIGIIKSVGATSSGVAGIFLGYGLAIGVVGSMLGLLFGWLITKNINQIHTWLGQTTGFKMWDPEVYAFDIIPNTMNPTEVIVIVVVAIVASVLGALVPAVRAAGMHPVDSLRWE
jgi:lipoprotein-releasing system permease protein